MKLFKNLSSFFLNFSSQTNFKEFVNDLDGQLSFDHPWLAVCGVEKINDFCFRGCMNVRYSFPYSLLPMFLMLLVITAICCACAQAIVCIFALSPGDYDQGCFSQIFQLRAKKKQQR